MIREKKKMSVLTIVIVILIGIAAGFLSGMVGVGGGLIIVPSLVFFLGFSQHSAQGTSLGLILLPVGILAVWEYYRQGHVDIVVVGVLAVGFLIGSLYGSKFALSLPQETLKKIFAVLMIVIAVKMIFFDSAKTKHVTTGIQSDSAIKK
jgi:uncharacterized membrane protein YfcA